MSETQQEIIDRLDAASRSARKRAALSGAARLVFGAALAVGWLTLSDQLHASDQQLAAVVRALDATQAQVEHCADQPAGAAECEKPVAPSSDEILEDPATAQPPMVIQESVDPARLADAARNAVEALVPGAVSSKVGPAVRAYVDACIASGECVGPPGAAGATGAPGEDGATPTAADVAAAVVSVCSSSLDCEVTEAEIDAAVAGFCAAGGCGTQWTEGGIEDIAERVVSEWLANHPIWCPSESSIPNDQQIGPCLASVG